jgi:hypothetical protein
MDLAKLVLGDALADIMELENGDTTGLEKLGLDFLNNGKAPRTDSIAASDDILGSDDEEESEDSRGPSSAENLEIHESEFRMP